MSTESGSVAARLFEIATRGGARSLGLRAGEIEPGAASDFFTLDLSSPSLQEIESRDLMTAFVFGGGATGHPEGRGRRPVGRLRKVKRLDRHTVS